MSMTWIYITLLVLVGGFVLQMMPLLIYFPAVFIVHLLIFGIGAYLIHKDFRIEERPNILFLGGLTVINILTALDILSYRMSWAAFLALLIWSFFGGGRGK